MVVTEYSSKAHHISLCNGLLPRGTIIEITIVMLKVRIGRNKDVILVKYSSLSLDYVLLALKTITKIAVPCFSCAPEKARY